jgi:DNA-binding CsgD family transcriptional regulator
MACFGLGFLSVMRFKISNLKADSTLILNNDTAKVSFLSPSADVAFSYLGRISTSQSIEEVWRLTTEILAFYGFDRINYGLTQYKPQGTFGDPKDALFLTSHPFPFAKQYFEGGYFATTPMYRWVSNNVGACSWQWSWDERASGRVSEVEAKSMDVNWEAGLQAGYSVSFALASLRASGAMGLTARPGLTQAMVDQNWAANQGALMAITNMAHLKLSQLPYKSGRKPLTSRQREVLEWLAEGKSIKDVCTILELSQVTIEKHLRQAREALGVDTTVQAVAKASFMNMIFIIEQKSEL